MFVGPLDVIIHLSTIVNSILSQVSHGTGASEEESGMSSSSTLITSEFSLLSWPAHCRLLLFMTECEKLHHFFNIF